MPWSLPELLAELHRDIEERLGKVRRAMGHAVAKGDASEGVWIDLLRTYLPKRYDVDKAFVVDSEGKFSDQIDVVVYDRQYSPFVFNYEEQLIIPAESVYAVFEAKQAIDAAQINYASNKVASVRQLCRTSLPIPHAGGTYDAKLHHPIIGGLLTFESDWKPPLGHAMRQALSTPDEIKRLDFGCIAAHGHFRYDKGAGAYEIVEEGKPATAFLLQLIADLQIRGTVPMIDVQAYARWLAK